MHATEMYLSSLDSARFAPVRTVHVEKNLNFNTGKPALLARIDPPVIGQDFGRDDIEHVILTPRHEWVTEDPFAELPCFVFIAVPGRSACEVRHPLRALDLEILGWGELYGTREDALNHRIT